jgi:glutathione S-transferase
VLLYDSPVSGNCYKVRLLLGHLGIPYERRTVDVVDRSNRPDLLAGLNPALRVPTLVLDDGRPLAESGAILWYFGEGTRFLPDDRYERAQVLQWMFFEQYDHEPAIAVARFWLTQARPPNSGGSTGRFRRIRGGASDPDGGTASGASAGRPEAFADRLEERTAAGHRALAAMERHLESRTFLVGDGMTLADIALYAYTHVADEGGFELDGYPAIRAWLGHVAAEPGHVPITA